MAQSERNDSSKARVSVNNKAPANILLVVNCVPKPLIIIVAVSPSPAASNVFFFSCPSLLHFFPSLFICLATNLMSASLLSLPLSVSLSLHNRSFRPSVSSISSSPLPLSWCSHWHLRRPVLCQTAIPQIEISQVLKSLRQIYYLNGREWRGGKWRAGARRWVGMAFWFANFGVLSTIGRAGDGQINRLRIIWVSFRLTDYPNVTIISSKEQRQKSKRGKVCSCLQGETRTRASGGISRFGSCSEWDMSLPNAVIDW